MLAFLFSIDISALPLLSLWNRAEDLRLLPIPRYLLLDETKPIGLELAASATEESAKFLYGFSDKPQYDSFRENSQLAYRPYPIVKGFLKNQLESKDGRYQFIAIDASGPRDESVNVASIEVVLEAFENNSTQLVGTVRYPSLSASKA